MDDSNLFVSGGLDARLQSYAAKGRHEPHAHDRASIGILVGGSLVERVGRTTQQGTLGAIIIKPAGVVHENAYGDAGTVILSVAGTYVDGMTKRAWEWRSVDRVLAHALAAIRDARAGRRLACEETLYLMLSELGEGRSGHAPSRKPSWLGEVVSITRREGPPTCISNIADRVGVHPVYLTRVFRKHFGCSLSAYIRRARVVRAAELLRSSSQRVCDVAAELEFFDQSHLCRAFKVECGVPPSEYRALVRRA